MNTKLLKPNSKKLNLLLIFTFNYKYLKYRNCCTYNLGNETGFYLIRYCSDGFVGVQNGKAEQPV